LDETEAARVFQGVLGAIQREFSRFATFPDANIKLQLMDRIHLHAMFRYSGNDYECPNVWGHMLTRTNAGRLYHQISVLSGLPRSAFQAVCAHECAHTWLHESLTATRARTLQPSAEEGFCELIAYNVMESLGEEPAKRAILQNLYTRGQIHALLQAQKQFGLNEIFDWVRFGVDGLIDPADVGRIRQLEQRTPRAVSPALAALPVRAPAAPATNLVLKAVFWSGRNPTALINDRSFELNDQHDVAVSGTNMTVRCVAIQPQSVRIRLVRTGEEKQLVLKTN